MSLSILIAAIAFADHAVGQDNPAALAPLVKLLGAVDDAELQLDVLTGIHDAVKGRRNVAMPTGWREVSAKLAESDSAAVREKALLLSLIFGDKQAAASLRKRVIDGKTPPAERTAALEALVQGRVAGLGSFLRSLLDDDVTRAASLRAMATLDDPAIPAVILGRYASLKADEKRDAVLTLTARPAFASALLDAIEKGDIPTRDVSAFAARQMLELGDAKIEKGLKVVWGSVRPTAADRVALIADFKARLTPKVLEKGDASRGRAVFGETCASCHKLFDAGQAIGPELTGSQRRNLDYVLSNLLDPNAVVGRDYRMTIVVTAGGRVVTGIVAEENAKTLTLQTANERVIVPKEEIDVRKLSSVSLMPEGMLQKLTTEQVRDLVVYLASPRQVPLPAEVEQPSR